MIVYIEALNVIQSIVNEYLPEHPMPTNLYLWSIFGNFVAAAGFVFVIGKVPEPWRRRTMVALLATASVTYLNGGLGALEWPLALAVAGFAILGTKSYRALGVGWLVHTSSDIAHHLAGLPMVNSMPLSSFGCAILDPLLALWFFAGAPPAHDLRKRFQGAEFGTGTAGT